MSRWASSLALALTGVTMLVCAATTDMWLVQLVVFLTGRFCATFAMNVSRYTGRYIYTYLHISTHLQVGHQWYVELMPTCLRGQGAAVVNVMSMISQMGSPYIVYSVRICKYF